MSEVARECKLATRTMSETRLPQAEDRIRNLDFRNRFKGYTEELQLRGSASKRLQSVSVSVLTVAVTCVSRALI